MFVSQTVGGELPIERRQRDAIFGTGAARTGGESVRAGRDPFIELRLRREFIDKAPVKRALALDAFLDRAEYVRAVAAYLALVDDAGQPAGAGQHREQRQFGQRHGGGAIVDQHDMVGRQRQLIAAARRAAADHAKEAQTGMFGRVFHRIARLIGELAEVHLVRMFRARQHADIGSGAKTPAACPNA